MESVNGLLAPDLTVQGADGETYRAVRVSWTIWSEFCEWVNGRMDRPAGFPVEVEEMEVQARTLPGMRWILWRCLSVHSPGLEIEHLDRIFPDPTASAEYFAAMVDAPEGGADPNPPEGTPAIP